ncbi:DNA cytosine methyltransferase [Pseudonocardia sp. ICBG601]|uniref:DNA cytosine methyltransferase n=1 Tax=Pseudonocardia sp. ICBG601 TaxID=2846759 RepID=UPI001CF6AFA1|nr:DNA cytosine methyltransferase [Pseudonocardia sp. ICBG601]
MSLDGAVGVVGDRCGGYQRDHGGRDRCGDHGDTGGEDTSGDQKPADLQDQEPVDGAGGRAYEAQRGRGDTLNRGPGGSLLTSVEICTGAGGQALGLEQAGFDHRAVVEIDRHACGTLRANRPEWNVIEQDLLAWDPIGHEGVDLLAGGVPCPPFSKAGRQLGADDERDLFPRAIELVDALRPKAVMLENVRGLLDIVFQTYRSGVEQQLKDLGYEPDWRLLNASDFGVSQLRPRVIFVAVRKDLGRPFEWPVPAPEATAPTVGEALRDLMAANGWEGADEWAAQANTIAPTLVGGSKKHGGPDLGPTRARRAWESLGVNGKTLAEEAPAPGFTGLPRLTVEMAARIQGFPPEWHITGRKTNAYRQVGNAFPPPVAKAVGEQIKATILGARPGLQVVA